MENEEYPAGGQIDGSFAEMSSIEKSLKDLTPTSARKG